MPREISQDELKEIVVRVQNGSAEDFQRLYDLFSKPIFNFVWRLIGSPEDAEDITQDTFVKVHTDLKNLREPKQFKFWLFRIARNEVYQKLRRSQKTTEVSIDDEDTDYYNFLADDASSSLDPETQVLCRELNDTIENALMKMPPRYRDVFVLAVFQKMSYEDITKVVGRSLLSVKTDIYRARLIAKEVLGEYLKKV
ncbi:MAG: RNA polymerase sigma factor [Acidobacteriota bacterium]